jgi:EAL domain-containing protein (putative c-di-GMP-specific phosphodiesterase class I)
MTTLQRILIVDDDAVVTEGLADVLSRRGREIVTCSTIESAQLVVERMPMDCVITDVRLTGPFRNEGLDFIGDVKRHSPGATVSLITGAPSAQLTREAHRRGAAAVLAKPFELTRIEELVGDPSSDEEPRLEVIPSIDDVVGSPFLMPFFQPVMELSGAGIVHGFEALARFETDSFLHMPEALFVYAARTGRIADLELACIRATFARCAPLAARGAKIFINIHPSLIGSRRLIATLDEMIATSNVPAAQIVLEITEQESLGEARGVARQCAALRSRGFTFALDDVGVAYSHLPHIDAISPKYLKVSQEFGGSFERDATKTKIVRNVLSLARDFDCQLVLEGVETASTRDAARDEGITLAQGYFFGRPMPIAELRVPGRSSRPRSGETYAIPRVSVR